MQVSQAAARRTIKSYFTPIARPSHEESQEETPASLELNPTVSEAIPSIDLVDGNKSKHALFLYASYSLLS